MSAEGRVEAGDVERTEAQKRWSNVIFGVLFVVSLLLFGRIMAPFLMPVLLGGLLVVLFEPVQRFLLRITRGRRAVSAGLATVAVILLIVIPVGAAAFLVGREVLGVLEAARTLVEDPIARKDLVARLPELVRSYLSPEDPSVVRDSHEMLTAAVSGTAAVLKEILGAGTGLAIDVFLVSVSMYYFFLDGRRLYAELARLLPMDRQYLDAFAKEFKDVAYAIVYGNTLTAVIQGAVGFVGLYVAGVPHPVVWAVAMMVVALIPVGGTALVWLPVSVVLLSTGQIAEGIGMLLWGGLVVSTLDNLLRPRLCGSRMTLHPLMVFLSMFGGLAVFGMMGLLVGPLISALFMAMVRIYRRDFLGGATAAVEKLTRSATGQTAQS